MSLSAPIEEVNFGESQERAVATLWTKISSTGKQAERFVKSGSFDPYDVLVIGARGVPLCVLEIKVRRVEWGTYGDILAPLKKHLFALELKERGLPYLLVTHYACGTLVEVDLSEHPKEEKAVARRDRPGMTPVMHGLWKGDQVKVLEP